MTLKLGDVVFNVGADTSALASSAADLQRFEKLLEEAASKQTAAAQKVTAALAKQGKAIRDAINKTIELNAAIRQSAGAKGDQFLARTNSALQEYISKLATGVVSSNQFVNANEKLDNTLNSVNNAIKRLKNSTSETAQAAAAAAQTINRTAQSINFPVGADAEQLQKTLQLYEQLTQAVDKNSRSKASNAEQTTNALRRQEKAAADAINQVAALNQQQRMAMGDKSADAIRKTNMALEQYVATLASGKLSQIDMQRATIAFNAALQNQRLALNAWKKDFSDGSHSVDSFKVAIRNMVSTITLALGPLSGAGARVAAMGGIIQRSGGAIASFVGSVVSATLSIGLLTVAAVRNASAMDPIFARFKFLSTGAIEAAESFDWLRETVGRTGGDLVTAGEQFTRLAVAAQGTKLEGQAIRDAFETVSLAAGKMQLSTEKTERTLLALEQMISKGKVSSEELRRQMGDQLPGAFVIAARSMGMTVAELDKLISEGKLFSEDFIPKFIAAMREFYNIKLGETIDNMNASFGRFRTNLSATINAFDKFFGISSTFKKVLDLVNSGLYWLEHNLHNVTAAIFAATAGMAAFNAVSNISRIYELGKAFIDLGKAILTMQLFTTVASGGLQGLLGTLARLAVAAGAAGLVFSYTSDALSGWNKVTGTAADKIDEFLKAQRTMGQADRERIQNLKREAADALSLMQVQMEEYQSKISAAREEMDKLRAGPQGRGRIVSAQIEQLQKFINEQIAGMSLLTMKADEYKVKIGQLNDILKMMNDADAERLRQAAKLRAEQLRDTDRNIEALSREADAIRKGADALAQFKIEQKVADAFEDLIKNLEKIDGLTDDEKTARIQAFSDAWTNFFQAQQASEIEKVAEAILKANKELEATKQGEEALKKLKAAFQIESTVASFAKSLRDVGIVGENLNRILEELRRSLQAVNDEARAQMGAAALTDVQKRIGQLQGEISAINKGRDAYDQFTAAIRRSQDVADRAKELAIAVDTGQATQAEVDAQLAQYEKLLELRDNALAAMRSANKGGAKQANSLFRVEAILREIKDIDELIEAMKAGEDAVKKLQDSFNDREAVIRFGKSLQDAGIDGQRAAAYTQEYTDALKRFREAEAEWGREAISNRRAVADLNAELELLEAKLTALSSGRGHDLTAIERAFKRTEELEKYKRSLEGIGLTLEQIEELFRRYAEVTENLMDPMTQGLMAAWDSVLEITTGAIDQVNRLITDTIMSLKFEMDSLKKIAENVAKDILNTFLRLTITNSISNALFNTALPIFGGFNQTGEKTKMARGGVINRPTALGVNAFGGEAGAEAVLPLTRVGNDLGVKANIGKGGSIVNVNVINNTGATISTRSNENADGSTSLEILIDDMVSAKMASPGSKINKTLARNFGIRSRVGGV